MKKWISENIVVCIIGAILGGISWANNQQLDAISLKQDKAILQTQAAADEKYVSKTWFTAANSDLKSADSANQTAIAAVAVAVSDIKTSIAVLTSEVRNSKQN